MPIHSSLPDHTEVNPGGVRQALIAVGGRSTRLRADGFDVPLSKSFIEVAGRPLLYWSLRALHCAGIREIVLCGNRDIYLREAEITLATADFIFDKATFFADPGMGVHGLPWHARSLLHDTFVFECGHSVMTSMHYRQLISKMRPNFVVASGFQPHPDNLRQPVRLKRGRVYADGTKRPHAIAHPFVIDQDYARRLPELGFSIERVIEYYASRRRLAYVKSGLPPEFDVLSEMVDACSVYESHLVARSGD